MLKTPPAVRIVLAAFSLVAGAESAWTQTIVGPDDIPYPEQIQAAQTGATLFRNDWSVLNNDIFFGGAAALFGLSPANLLRRSTAQITAETSSTASSGGGTNNQSPNESLFSFATASSAQFASGGGTVNRPSAPNAPLAAKTWNNSGTDFNADASWTGGKPGLNDIATFNVLKVTDPIVTSTSTQTVLGISFETAAFGYTISSASPFAFLGVGTGGITASNITGTNSITAGLLLNFDQSITQASGGTLNITGPVRLGGGEGTTVLTIGDGSGGIINFLPSAAEIGNTIHFVTNVDVILPAIVSETLGAGIIKSGNATLNLTAGSPTVDGTTTVNAGTLLITNPSGSATGTGTVVVNNSGTLAGNGSINAGSNTITINGTLSPGPLAAAGNPGTINLASTAGAGALTLSSTSTFRFDIDTIAPDLVALTSTGVSLGGGTLALTLGGNFDYDGQYAIFTGVSGLTGSFGSVTGFDSVNYAPVFTLNGSEYDLTFAPIPEPATWVGGVLALSAIGFAKRKKLKR